MKVMAAGSFKAHCLRVMDEVQKRRQPVLITKRGKPVAKLVPADEVTRDVFGSMRGRIEIRGDIVAPVLPAEAWDVLK